MNEIIINPIFQKALSDKNFYLFLYGSADSGKSYFGIQKLLLRAINERNHKFLICRKVGRTLRHSCFDLLCEQIANYDLNNFFTINKTDMTLYSKQFNSQFIFIGLDDVLKLKSIHGITGILVEEITECEQQDLLQLSLRIRGKTEYPQIICLFNPLYEGHWLEKFMEENSKVSSFHSVYTDNFFINKRRQEAIEALKETDYYMWQVYGLGLWGVLGDRIFNNFEVVENLTDIKFDKYFFGCDFGWTHKSACVQVAIKDNEIYIIDEWAQKGCTLEKMSGYLKEFVGNNKITCDSSEPRSIEYLRAQGLNAVPAIKGKDSLRTGLDWLRTKKIKIAAHCINFYNEISRYCWRRDKNGITLNEPQNFEDDVLAALRYAVEELFRGGISFLDACAKLGIRRPLEWLGL